MKWGLVILGLAACQLGTPVQRGEPCDRDGECESGSCQGNVCSGGSCRPNDPACSGDFECVWHDGGFLGDSYYRCEMLCNATDHSCPDWYFCSGTKYCSYTGLMITFTPEMPVANEPVTFTGSFFEDKPRRAASWLFETDRGVPSFEGETATVTFPDPGEVNAVFTGAYEGDGNAYQTQLRLTIHEPR